MQKLMKSSVDLLEAFPKLVSFVLGALFVLGFAPTYLWGVSLLCVAGFYHLILQAPRVGVASKIGYFFAFGSSVVGLYWLYSPFYMDLQNYLFAIAVGIPVTLGLSSFLAIYGSAAAAFFWRFKDEKNVAPFLFAGFWVVAEVGRSVLFTGFPWNLAGYVWADNIYLMQIASVGHIWLMSFLVMLSGALLAIKRGYIVTIALLVAVAGYGAFVLKNAPQVGTQGVPFALVQPNIEQPRKWQRHYQKDHFQTLLELSNAEQSDIVIWPETAVTTFLEDYDALRMGIMEHLSEGQVLVTGAPRKVVDAQGEELLYNSIFVLNDQGEVTDSYNKHLLVPFGEYVPMRGLLPPFIQKMVHGRKDYSFGKEDVALKIKDLTALPLICYEAIFPHFVAEHAEGKDFLLVVTNDAWFDGTLAPYQHDAMARIRAVEQRLPLLRVANTGMTSYVDAYGRRVARSQMHQKGVVLGSL